MRPITQKLSLVVVALLLANCGISSDEGTQNDEAAATSSDTSNFDSREGLSHVRDVSRKVRLTRSDAVADAIAYLSEAAESAGVASPEFKVLNVTEKDPADGLTHVRLQQTFQGMLVWGADSVVHLNGSEALGAAGTVATKLAGTPTASSMSPNAALAKAKTERFGTRQVVTEREAVERVIHVGDDGVARVAIHTKFFNELQGDVQPAFWNHIYDANSGELLARWNDVHTLDEASGVSGNPKVVHAWNHELDVEPKADKWVMTTARLQTLNMNNGASTGTEVVGTLESIGDAAINDAHGYAEVTLNMMKDWMNRDSIDDHNFRIKSRVHYNRNYENAFWDGSQMTYGDGANTFYPLSGGVDVCAHEINHGYTTKHSNLAYSNQPGGLNEGFSDIAGKTAEYYYRETGNFDLGGDVFKQPGKALRYMCDPPKDGKSIDKAANMRPTLDPHYSSGIPNKVFCVASKRMSSGDPAAATASKDGVKRTAQAFYLANGQYWTSSTTFVQACQGVLDAARAMNYTEEEVNYLKASWADVGVACN